MVKIPEEVKAAIDKTSPVCIATVDEKNVPNIVYVTFLKRADDSTIMVADNKFDKTKRNILANGKLSFVVLDPDTKKAYQLKGKTEYFDRGEKFEAVRDWVLGARPDLQPKGAVYLTVTEIYCGAEKVA